MDFKKTYKLLFGQKKKIIGWGTSKGLHDIYDRLSFKIDYLVDSDMSKWGSQVHGLTICDPKRIKSEDVHNTVILIFSYSYYEEIRKTIKDMGNYEVIHPAILNIQHKFNNSFLGKNSYYLFYPIWWILNATIKLRYKKVQMKKLLYMHIGHLAGNTEICLRQESRKKDDDRALTIFICDFNAPFNDVCNKRLLQMIKRKAWVIENPTILCCFFNVMKIDILSWCNNGATGDIFSLPSPEYQYDEFNNIPRQLSFIKEEMVEGAEIIKKMGLESGSEFVCFHSRDTAYFDKILQGKDADSHCRHMQSHDIRNFSIGNLLPAIEYLSQQGIYGLRMGHSVSKPIMSDNPKIIDYACNYRTEFGDLYLSAHCKFFISGTTGLNIIPIIFDIPLAVINMIPLGLPTFSSKDLFINKKLWSIGSKRFLTFSEQLAIEGDKWVDKISYADYGVEIIDNSIDEIIELAKEMNDRIDGVWVTTEEDEELQRRYKALFINHPCEGFPSRIGTAFLRNNKDLIK